LEPTGFGDRDADAGAFGARETGSTLSFFARRTGEATAGGKAVVYMGWLGSLSFLVFLFLRTRRRGLGKFRWYASAAIWVGMTIGATLAL